MQILFLLLALNTSQHTPDVNSLNVLKIDASKKTSVCTTAADTATLNGQWFLQPMLASDTATGKIPVLQIDVSAGTFSGNTGCNRMRGRFQKTDSSLLFGKEIITTKMNCAGYDEAAFIRALLHTNNYKIEKGTLILMFDATEISRWTRKPDRKVKMNRA